MASAGNSKDNLSLNLNPMLDIFSILITFLLMSFSSDPVSHDTSVGLELPESTTIVALDEIPSIIVSKDQIQVNGRKVASIFSGDVEEKDMSQGAVYPVYTELLKLAEANKRLLLTKPDMDKSKTSSLTMEMDKTHRFKLMKRIMLAAQQAEFITFKMSVSKEIN
jgi:hypothetical protein